MKMYMITQLYKIHSVPKRFVYYLCAVGIVMINANRSSMNVLNALYIKARQGRWATDWKMIIVKNLYRITDKYFILKYHHPNVNLNENYL